MGRKTRTWFLAAMDIREIKNGNPGLGVVRKERTAGVTEMTVRAEPQVQAPLITIHHAISHAHPCRHPLPSL
jgi:hypothetical protein